MRLNRLKEIVDAYVNDGLGNRAVVINLDEPSIGCRASTSIQDIFQGIDWESSQIRIQTEDKICRLDISRDNPMKMNVFAHITSRKHYACPVCDEFVKRDDRWCPHCGQRIVYDPNQKPIDE